MKQNQTRWLQNGRNSIKLLKMIEMKTERGIPCLVEYGLKLTNTGKNSIQKRIAKEIAIWFSMPTIIAAYHFEDELTAYKLQWDSIHHMSRCLQILVLE
jgi:hypothetical protein